MNSLLVISFGPYAEFYGFDIILYYWYVIESFMRDYSWQVRVTYAIILMCIVAMLVLGGLFSMQSRRRETHAKNFMHCYRTYAEPFHQILSTREPLTTSDIYEICDASEEEFDEYGGMLMAEVILHLRMNMHDQLYLPNLQILCETTGVRLAIESRLKARKHVFQMLQIVNTLPLYINEGLLTVYTTSRDKQIAGVARMCHLAISRTEPYLYLLDDMNEPQEPWWGISLHRLLGWKHEQGMPIAPLHMLASTCTIPHIAAFLIDELSYWGTEEDKLRLPEFFDDERQECRMTAVKAVARLRIPHGADLIFDAYKLQPQPVRRVMQKALLSYHEERFTEFYVAIFQNTPSHESRRIALNCLYYNTEHSRERFEELSLTADAENKVFFDQIRTLALLKEQRAKQEAAENSDEIVKNS